jgi:hypothetical protein
LSGSPLKDEPLNGFNWYCEQVAQLSELSHLFARESHSRALNISNFYYLQLLPGKKFTFKNNNYCT